MFFSFHLWLTSLFIKLIDLGIESFFYSLSSFEHHGPAFAEFATQWISDENSPSARQIGLKQKQSFIRLRRTDPLCFLCLNRFAK
jgi:hypothetical protein